MDFGGGRGGGGGADQVLVTARGRGASPLALRTIPSSPANVVGVHRGGLMEPSHQSGRGDLWRNFQPLHKSREGLQQSGGDQVSLLVLHYCTCYVYI